MRVSNRRTIAPVFVSALFFYRFCHEFARRFEYPHLATAAMPLPHHVGGYGRGLVPTLTLLSEVVAMAGRVHVAALAKSLLGAAG